ncbi:unnamed protein product [Cuscuta campestris]|uniref:GTPase Der C-terminal KH-domain-like domain-containing protein n=1 Tax=Cuscuta campestris TaxID=132261 RepID=A0A484MYD3_9ASTE|nr:unnamed protein product [Cuscuta campestris]
MKWEGPGKFPYPAKPGSKLIKRKSVAKVLLQLNPQAKEQQKELLRQQVSRETSSTEPYCLLLGILSHKWEYDRRGSLPTSEEAVRSREKAKEQIVKPALAATPVEKGNQWHSNTTEVSGYQRWFESVNSYTYTDLRVFLLSPVRDTTPTGDGDLPAAVNFHEVSERVHWFSNESFLNLFPNPFTPKQRVGPHGWTCPGHWVPGASTIQCRRWGALHREQHDSSRIHQHGVVYLYNRYVGTTDMLEDSGSEGSTSTVNQPLPGEQAALPVMQEAAANQAAPVPYPYPHNELIGGDCVESIQRRLLGGSPFPSAHAIQMARIDAEDLFEAKVDICRVMAGLHPDGDWMGRGAWALANPRTLTGEDSLENLLRLRDGVVSGDATTVTALKQRIRGILLNRRNIPIMSMPIESMLLAVNSNFLVFSVSSDDMMGQSFASLVPTVAAAESAIGLAIFVITFRVRGTIAVESINSIQGSTFGTENKLGSLGALPSYIPVDDSKQGRAKLFSLSSVGSGRITIARPGGIIYRMEVDPLPLTYEVEGVLADPSDGTKKECEARLKFCLIDTAGIRKKGAVASSGSITEALSVNQAFRAIRRADVVALVIEAMACITEQDWKIAERIEKEGKGCVIVVNKWDTIPNKNQSTATYYEQDVREKLRLLGWAPIVYSTAIGEHSVDKIISTANIVEKERSRRLTTSILNQVIWEAVALKSPPRTRGGKRGRVYYCTQAAIRPPTFVFFVNDAKLFPETYRRYMEKQLRSNAGFSGTPIRLLWRSRRKTKG